MSLAAIREKNRKSTTLINSKITKTVCSEDAKQLRSFFKQVVEPVNQDTWRKYVGKA